jgi:threonine aldolase
MRQAGLLAAAAIYAIENNVPRMKLDHENAARFAGLFRGCGSLLAVDYDSACTSLVFIELAKGAPLNVHQLVDRMKEASQG